MNLADLFSDFSDTGWCMHHNGGGRSETGSNRTKNTEKFSEDNKLKLTPPPSENFIGNSIT